MWIGIGLIFALVLYVISANVRYAVRQYLANSNRMLFTLYMIFLLLFGVIVVRSTLRIVDLFQDAKEVLVDPVAPDQYTQP